MSTFLRSLTLSLLLLAGLIGRAQDDDEPPAGEKPDTFRINLASSVKPVAHSLYDRLEVIDERADKGELGWINNGTYYGLQICLTGPLDEQLGQVLQQLTDSSAGRGELLVEMRRFEVYDDGQRTVSVLFRVFGGREGLYSFVKDVDTTVSVKAVIGGGKRRKFAALINGVLSASLADVLRKPGDSTTGLFTRATAPYADQLWERQLPLYQSEVYPDGVYARYESFARLRPDYTRFRVSNTKNPENGDLLLATPEDSSEEVPPSQIYGFVLNGKAYVTTDGRFRPLFKKDGEFYTTGKVGVGAPGADAAVTMASFALAAASLGRLPFVRVWGATVKKNFLLRLDYRTGRFVPVRPVD